jgi:hypothetical protein
VYTIFVAHDLFNSYGQTGRSFITSYEEHMHLLKTRKPEPIHGDIPVDVNLFNSSLLKLFLITTQ